MADSKISQLTGGGAAQATDEYVVARAGGNNKITGANVAAAATSVGTLTSLTVSGNLAVDTNTLYVDAANNRVGVGTASPATTLEVNGTTTIGQEVFRSSDNSYVRISGGNGAGQGANLILFGESHATVPGQVSLSARGAGSFVSTVATGSFQWFTGALSTEKMRLDASGNLGLGVTPSAWDTAVFRTVQIGTGAGSASLSGRADGAKDMILASNVYYGAGNFRYIANGVATQYRTDGGSHAWSSHPSGTAGNALSTATATMTLSAAGGLSVGITTDAGAGNIAAAGDFRLNANSFSRVADLDNSGGFGGGYNFYIDTATPKHDSTGTIAGYYYTANGTVQFYTGGSAAAGTTATERARITAGGDVAIGATAKLFLDGVAATGDTYIQESSANVMAFTVAGTNSLSLTSSGLIIYAPTTGSAANVYLSGDGAYLSRSTSSVRFKQDVESIEEDHAFDAVLAMRPVTYRGKTDEDQRRHVGFIAEEMQEIAPLLCTYDEGGEEGTPNYVTYDRVTAYLVCAIQKQQKTIEALEARLEALEA